MKTYIDCWIQVASGLLPQALSGEPDLVETLPRLLGENAFGFAATLSGDDQGQFSVALDGAVLETPLLGEGVDQKDAWGQLLREIVEAASAELLAATGRHCRLDQFDTFDALDGTAADNQATRAFELKSGERSWAILVGDGVRAAPAAPRPEKSARTPTPQPEIGPAAAPDIDPAPALRPGLELLLDVELEVSLRFGSREMPLGQILELGPGDVVQLDRHVSDPVDLIVGDKIVARGEVVLINGNFGLRVTEVAAPRKRLESIRCLF